MNKFARICLVLLAPFAVAACAIDEDSNERQAREQEVILQEGTSAVGMPNIVNFRERRILKDIIEMRDQELTTYTYQIAEQTGQLVFFCQSIGFPISSAMQFTNPMRQENVDLALPQADPNGLFSPDSAEGTWVMCVNPTTGEAVPVYSEPELTASPYRMTADTPQ